MPRIRTVLALTSLTSLTALLGACSPKAPPAGEVPKTARESPPPVTKAQAAAAVGTGKVTPPPPPDPREATLSEAVIELVEQKHLLREKVDDTLSKSAFTTYMDRLDSGKMFLLEADRAALARHADKIDDELRAGRLGLAHDGAAVFATRVAVVEKMVTEILATPMDFTNEEYLELDSKKVQPAPTEAALRDRWRQRLELEVLESTSSMEARLAAATAVKADPKAKADLKADADKAIAAVPTTPEAREIKAREDLAKTYAGRFARLRTPGPMDAAADVVNAVTAALDPHTDYLPPAAKANFDIAMSGSLEGIGARLQEKDHYIEVVEIVPGGASARQGGIDAGDTILAVENPGQPPVDVFDLPIDDVVKMIRGPKGTVVKLKLQKQAGAAEMVAITRDKIVIEETFARGAILTRKGRPAFGYINLPGFYGGRDPGQRRAGEDVAYLLGQMKAKKVAGVVLDLRSDGGGLLDEAVELTGALIDKGPVVEVQDYDHKREVLADTHEGEAYDGKLVVLVDRFSASASEIVAGALQDYRRAIIVGQSATTHGKGTVQTVIDLDRLTGGRIELGELKLTIQQFFRPGGSSTQRRGVVPDVVLPDPAGYIESGESTLDHAIAWSSIDKQQFTLWPWAWDGAALAKASALRVAKNATLTKVAGLTALLKTRQQDTRIPLQRTAWEARRKEQKAAIEAASPDLAKAPALYTVTIVADQFASAKPAAAKEPPPGATPPTPGAKPADGGGAAKVFDPSKTWRETLARDPWVDECLNILADAK